MWKNRSPRHLAALVVLGSLAATGSVPAQERGDPIGPLVRTSTYDRAQRVNVGKSSAGKVACFFREQGSSHQTDIGMSADGAFIRVEHGDGRLPPEAIPQPPLQVFAGKEVTKVVDGDEKATGEYERFHVYDGAIEYRTNIKSQYDGGFVVVANGDPKPFFDMIARARGEFVIVQSIAAPKKLDVIAIYEFKASTAAALLSCAQKNVKQ